MTAIEYLVEKLKPCTFSVDFYNALFYDEINKAKEMEREEMLNFAWWLSNNLGQYSCDEKAHFEGKYLEQWKKL